ncbi:uncharacterized protein LOC106055263 isoform X2 [Biomphalaria glabrata]|uniref:Uncharacterized protein LOC106055263 isoform X2 n=1 Tax=Biomphalaria glabrata TaxID=6526 RepID=A0A9W2YXP8_BIOGL|nr:uncharacterized protein LOC106055263 isoform X2 [Biomphalaria glabrata]
MMWKYGLLLVLFIMLTIQQEIIISERFESNNSSCTTKLVPENKLLLFDSEIDISEADLDNLPAVQYELKKSDSGYVPFCYFKLKNLEEYKSEHCLCNFNTTKAMERFHVFISIPALPDFSEATLRGRLWSPHLQIRSEEQKLPKIFDPQKIETLLYVNNELANITECNHTINGSDVTILVIVQIKMDLPLELKLIANNNRTVKRVGSNVLIYSTRFIGQQTFTIIYEMCKNEEYSRAFTCSIQSGNASLDNETKSVEHDNLFFNLLLFELVLVILLTAVLSIIAKRQLFLKLKETTHAHKGKRRTPETETTHDYSEDLCPTISLIDIAQTETTHDDSEDLCLTISLKDIAQTETTHDDSEYLFPTISLKDIILDKNNNIDKKNYEFLCLTSEELTGKSSFFLNKDELT